MSQIESTVNRKLKIICIFSFESAYPDPCFLLMLRPLFWRKKRDHFLATKQIYQIQHGWLDNAHYLGLCRVCV